MQLHASAETKEHLIKINAILNNLFSEDQIKEHELQYFAFFLIERKDIDKFVF